MANYRNDNYRQTCFVAVNLEEQLVPGTFEHALHHLIEHYLDLSDFDADYNNDESGRPAYHPGVMLRIVLFCILSRYLHVTSDRLALSAQRHLYGACLSRGTALDHHRQLRQSASSSDHKAV